MSMLEKGNKNLLIAMSLALLGHLIILAWQIVPTNPTLSTIRPITISLSKAEQKSEPPLVEKKLALPKPVVQAASNPNPKPKIEQPSDLVTVEEPIDEQQASVVLNTHSESFIRFLQNERELDRQASPRAAQQFADTFKPYFLAQPTAKDIAYEQGSLGGGQYKVRKNGKVVCMLQMVPQTFDDLNGNTFPAASRDCSPKKRFEPNLRLNTLD